MITFINEKKMFISEHEMIKIQDLFENLIKQKKKFFIALRENNLTFEEIFCKNFDNSKEIFNNNKIHNKEKIEYLNHQIYQKKISKNIMALSIMCFHSEINNIEQEKLKNKTQGFGFKLKSVRCYLCGNFIEKFTDDNEVILFPNCKHAFHLNCDKKSDFDNLFCIKCLDANYKKENNSIKNK